MLLCFHLFNVSSSRTVTPERRNTSVGSVVPDETINKLKPQFVSSVVSTVSKSSWFFHVFLNAALGGPCWAGLNVHLQLVACRWWCFSGCGSRRGRRTGAVTASGGSPPGPRSYRGDDRRGPRRSSDPSRRHRWADPPPSSETQSPVRTSPQPITAQLSSDVTSGVCVTLLTRSNRSLRSAFRSLSPLSLSDRTPTTSWYIWLAADIRLTHMSCRGRHTNEPCQGRLSDDLRNLHSSPLTLNFIKSWKKNQEPPNRLSPARSTCRTPRTLPGNRFEDT